MHSIVVRKPRVHRYTADVKVSELSHPYISQSACWLYRFYYTSSLNICWPRVGHVSATCWPRVELEYRPCVCVDV
eukprot:1367489-Amorphochlora_amoeboformis.AAC.1